jgi:hypothetical protein
MRRAILPFLFAAAVAACSRGDKDPRPLASLTEPTIASSAAAPLRQAGAAAALRRAAEQAAEIESFRGELALDMEFGGQSFGFDGGMVFRAPDQFQMLIEMFGLDFEMLIYGSRFYMDVGDGYREMDLAAAGIDLKQFEEITKNRGLLDLGEISDFYGDDLKQLHDDDIDGTPHNHYAADLTAADIAGQIPDGLLDPALADQVRDAIDHMTIDVWIDPETGLTRRTALSMVMEIPGAGDSEMNMRMDFLEYNGDVEMPEEPLDAPPFDPGEIEGAPEAQRQSLH